METNEGVKNTNSAIGELSFEAALAFAQSLATIPDFPRYEAAVHATAEDLGRWCKGAVVNGVGLNPEEQAALLVNEARENWYQWQGTAALRALFRSKFERPNRPELMVLDFGEKPPIDCNVCNDNGYYQAADGKYQFCECPAGLEMTKSMPDFLHKLNKCRQARARVKCPTAVKQSQPWRATVETDLFPAADAQQPEGDSSGTRRHQRGTVAAAEGTRPAKG
jgi:hypothetical protein